MNVPWVSHLSPPLVSLPGFFSLKPVKQRHCDRDTRRLSLSWSCSLAQCKCEDGKCCLCLPSISWLFVPSCISVCFSNALNQQFWRSVKNCFLWLSADVSKQILEKWRQLDVSEEVCVFLCFLLFTWQWRSNNNVLHSCAEAKSRWAFSSVHLSRSLFSSHSKQIDSESMSPSPQTCMTLLLWYYLQHNIRITCVLSTHIIYSVGYN